jgi:hypothetical protein
MTQTRVFGICAVVMMAASSLTACSSNGTDRSRSASSIGTTANPTPADATLSASEPTFSYSDGAGNRYELDELSRTLVFIPVEASDSSSGSYSGGPRWSQVISQDQYQKLKATFTKAIAATVEHTSARSKGTGVVELGSGEQTILKMSSSIRKTLESDLKALGTSAVGSLGRTSGAEKAV